MMGHIQQRKTEKHAPGCTFIQTYCILVKILSFGEQMVFQHGFAAPLMKGFFVVLVFFCFGLFYFKPYYSLKDSYQQAFEELCWLNGLQNCTKKRRQFIFQMMLTPTLLKLGWLSITKVSVHVLHVKFYQSTMPGSPVQHLFLMQH